MCWFGDLRQSPRKACSHQCIQLWFHWIWTWDYHVDISVPDATDPTGREKGVQHNWLKWLILISKGKLGCFYTMETRRQNLEARWFSGAPVVFPCLVVKVNRKLQQSKPGRKLKTQTFRKEGLGQPTSWGCALRAGEIQNGLPEKGGNVVMCPIIELRTYF